MKIDTVIKPFTKKEVPDVRPGDTVKVFQKFKDKDKEKTQIFEGLVIARKHGKEIGATITVRKVIGGVGVEKIFPLHLPSIDKIEILKRSKVRRAKLYYLRTAKGKRARLKRKEIKEKIKPSGEAEAKLEKADLSPDSSIETSVKEEALPKEEEKEVKETGTTEETKITEGTKNTAETK